MIKIKTEHRYYKEHLLPDEDILFVSDIHFFTRLHVHMAFIVGTTIFVARGAAYVYPSWPFTFDIVMAGCLLIFVIVFIYFLLRRLLLIRQGLIMTDFRMIIIHNNFFTSHIDSIEYTNIIEFEVNQNFLGSLFGYGDIVLEVYEMRERTLRHYQRVKKIEKILLTQLSKYHSKNSVNTQ